MFNVGQQQDFLPIAISIFQEFLPVAILIIAIMLVPIIIRIIPLLFSRGSGGGNVDIKKEQKEFGRKLTKKERKKVLNYLEEERYKEALKKGTKK